MTQDNSIVIREYLTTDKEVVINLIKLNTPNFFAKEEVNDLSNYLDKGIELYYVLLVDGKVVGCGGINFAEKRTIGKISWDIMHPDYQGKSLGKKLLRYRIEVLKAIPSIKKITVRTSQLAYKFVSVSAILSCRPFFILIFLPYIKMNHYGFSRKSIWKNLETFP